MFGFEGSDGASSVYYPQLRTAGMLWFFIHRLAYDKFLIDTNAETIPILDHFIRQRLLVGKRHALCRTKEVFEPQI